MSGSLKSLKHQIRLDMKGRLNALGAMDRQRLSAEAVQRISQRPEWKNAPCVLLYSPMERELSVTELIALGLKAGKVVCLPRFTQDTRRYETARINSLTHDLRPGAYGILEPAPSCDSVPIRNLALLIVPGLAFDLEGRRLGRGQGHYDQMLDAADGLAWGVGFEEQLVQKVPIENHDVRMDAVVTPKQWVGTSRFD